MEVYLRLHDYPLPDPAQTQEIDTGESYYLFVLYIFYDKLSFCFFVYHQ